MVAFLPLTSGTSTITLRASWSSGSGAGFFSGFFSKAFFRAFFCFSLSVSRS